MIFIFVWIRYSIFFFLILFSNINSFMKTGIKVGKNIPYVLNLCVHHDKKKKIPHIRHVNNEYV